MKVYHANIVYSKNQKELAVHKNSYLGVKDGKVGSLTPGYDFDALLIDGLDDAARPLTPEQIVERFCYIGNASNIKARWIRGQMI